MAETVTIRAREMVNFLLVNAVVHRDTVIFFFIILLVKREEGKERREREQWNTHFSVRENEINRPITVGSTLTFHIVIFQFLRGKKKRKRKNVRTSNV